ncbi:hypothetical protein [Thioalkalivibrio sp.]|uniref:hypothetical protein n=1 Tax=Thioalkalivibrio sp. TaxID=2093813 RepID=UPI003975FB2F
MSDAPKRIWLQMDGPSEYDWTWASHEIGEPDIEEVEYVRADLVGVAGKVPQAKEGERDE